MIIGPKTGSKSSILTNQLVNSDQGIGPHAQLSGGNGNSRQGSWRLPIISLDTESDSGHVRFGFEGLAKPGRVMSKAYQSIAQGFRARSPGISMTMSVALTLVVALALLAAAFSMAFWLHVQESARCENPRNNSIIRGCRGAGIRYCAEVCRPTGMAKGYDSTPTLFGSKSTGLE